MNVDNLKNDENFNSIVLSELPIIKRGMFTWLPIGAVLLAKERGILSKDEVIIFLENIKKREEFVKQKNVPEKEIEEYVKTSINSDISEDEKMKEFKDIDEHKQKDNIPF